MIIRNFIDSDIEKASKIAHLTWGDMYKNESSELQSLIYDYMVLYYDLNRDFSFSIFDEDFKGFILASTKLDRNNNSGKFKEKVELLNVEQEKSIALELYNYLEFSGQKVKAFMTSNDVMLGLFVSIKKGCGKMLLSKLIETCKEKSIENIYLWSDTTCDYDYYQKNGFELIHQISSIVNKKQITTVIYKKSI